MFLVRVRKNHRQPRVLWDFHNVKLEQKIRPNRKRGVFRGAPQSLGCFEDGLLVVGGSHYTVYGRIRKSSPAYLFLLAIFKNYIGFIDKNIGRYTIIRIALEKGGHRNG